MRKNSHSITRMICARSGTSMPQSFSTLSTQGRLLATPLR